MALYTIGDLHLGLGVNKPMDVFGDRWANHSEKLKIGFSNLTDNDLCVLAGDISWGMDLDECLEDFLFIDALPGKKLILKGNHDYWWSTANKAKTFFKAHGIETIDILYNNSFQYDGISICGTRGWFYEEEKGVEHDKKIMRREVMRLEASLKAGGEGEKVVFLHYPPIYQNYMCEPILDLLSQYRVRRCYYGHIHGKGCALAFNGTYQGTQYRLISADYVNFRPVEVNTGTEC